MNLAELERLLDSGGARVALARALALMPEQSKSGGRNRVVAG